MTKLTQKVRIDKWLWAVRLYKSRTLATDICKAGKVRSNGFTLKPSTNVSIGDIIEVKKNGFNLTFRVADLIEKRVAASLAVLCFEDLTPPEELSKYKDWYVGKSGTEYRERGDGRPTKKERREIDEFKDIYMDDSEVD